MAKICDCSFRPVLFSFGAENAFLKTDGKTLSSLRPRRRKRTLDPRPHRWRSADAHRNSSISQHPNPCQRLHSLESGLAVLRTPGRPQKSGDQAKQAIGRSSGGLTTKLHAACADDSTAVSLSLSAGQSHDATAFPAVWEGVPKSRWLDAAVMDKAYDSDNIRKFLEKQGVEAVIPPRANRKMLFPYDQKKYRMRQKVERFFG